MSLPPSLSRPRLLVVEDEAIVVADLQDRLAALGYDVVGTADSVESALQQTRLLQPDLVLMDIMLRGPARGTEAAKIIREELKLPVVYLTANTDDRTFIEARNTNLAGYILKPFEDRELRIVIEIALYKHRAECERETLIRQLEEALVQVKALRGMLPICAWCKKIRDDKGYWTQVEQYICDHSEAVFTHGMCPECTARMLQEDE